MKEKIIHGVRLVERVCICGCDRNFWVMPKSKQAVASVYCEPRKNGWKEQRNTSKLLGIPAGAVTVAGLSKELGIPANTIYVWARTKKIPSLRAGRKGLHFDLKAVKRSLEKKPGHQ